MNDKPLQILIDADSIYFRIAMATKKEKDMRVNIKKSLMTIENECALFGDTLLRIAVKGKGNFRHNIAENYKGNRKRELDPSEKKALAYGHRHMVEHHGAIMADDMEADDLVSIWAWECIANGDPYVVVHIDKDLNMIPGQHYNFVKNDYYFVSFEEAHLNFMLQCLTGDAIDNIPGVKGIGPKKSQKLLENCPFDRRWQTVRNKWKDKKQLETSARLLWMATSFEEAEGANASLMEYIGNNSVESFWGLSKNKEASVDEEQTHGETPECEQDVCEEGEDDIQDSGLQEVSGGDPGRYDGGSVAIRREPS